MAVQHLRLVCGLVAALTLLTLSQIRQQVPRPASVHQLVVLNSVLAIAACSLLFCSTGFAIAGWLLLYRAPKHARAGLHFTDSAPTSVEQRALDRATAIQTLVAANWACAVAFVGLFYALQALRWALPPLPAWGTTAVAALCATNVCTGAVLAAKNSRWAPWLLPGTGAIPLNEPCRLVAFLEQLHARCLSPRPKLPKARCGGVKRALRRSATWDSFPGVSMEEALAVEPSPCSQGGPQQGSANLRDISVIIADCDSGSSFSSCSSNNSCSEDRPFLPCNAAFAFPRRELGDETAQQGTSRPPGFAQGLSQSPLQGPPRGIGRTFSEDQELDLSAGSMCNSSASSCYLSPPSSNEGDQRLFLDMLQANIMTHPDDTLQFLARVSPERPAAPSSLQQQRKSAAKQIPAFSLPNLAQSPVLQQTQPLVAVQSQSNLHNDAIAAAAAGIPLVPLLQLPTQPSQPQPPLGSASAVPCAERRQQMTRVSATVDELLGAIVGELV